LEGNPEVGLFGVDPKGQDHWIRLPATTCEASKLPHDDHLDSLLPPHLDLVPLVAAGAAVLLVVMVVVVVVVVLLMMMLLLMVCCC
jgi:hypothetical protein